MLNTYNKGAPTRASYLTAGLYHVTGAPRLGLGCKPPRAMRAALVAHGLSAAMVRAWLNANYARHLAGKPLHWPA